MEHRQNYKIPPSLQALGSPDIAFWTVGLDWTAEGGTCQGKPGSSNPKRDFSLTSSSYPNYGLLKVFDLVVTFSNLYEPLSALGLPRDHQKWT